MRVIAESATLTLLLVRHGETTWNAEGRWQGQRDIPLSDRGRQQAALLRDRLAASWRDGLLPGPPDAVFSSDLARAAETAEILGRALPVPLPLQKTPLLQERHFGAWEGLTNAEVRARFGDARQPEDGEPYETVEARIREAFAHIWGQVVGTEFERTGRRVVLVVGHGGSLRFLLARSLGVGLEAARKFRLANTGLSQIDFTGVAPDIAEGRLTFANDTAHLTGGLL